ncbi:MAG: GerMN domain-containing protein [Clostridia bacterium]|nr:GerMN domain-containing protein [Clostridia bacterium]
MKKIILCILLAFVFTILGHERIEEMLMSLIPQQETQETAAPAPAKMDAAAQLAPSGAGDTLDVTLYFRYEDTGLLGAQLATLDVRREETIATAIVMRLLSGPQEAGSRLRALFPQGTRLISVSGQGTTAFVTLSRDFLGRPSGAPADWEDLALWQEEAALRRQLAVQSLVLSLTEDGRYQRVQLYLADNDDDIPERVPMAYFSVDVEDPGTVLGACSRDESFLLTPQRALDRVLSRWQKKDWEAVYELLASGDEALPTQSAFAARMRELDVSLLDYETTAGTVSFDGQRATLVMNAQLRSQQGGDARLDRETVALLRDGGNWAMTYDTLLSLMVRE